MSKSFTSLPHFFTWMKKTHYSYETFLFFWDDIIKNFKERKKKKWKKKAEEDWRLLRGTFIYKQLILHLTGFCFPLPLPPMDDDNKHFFTPWMLPITVKNFLYTLSIKTSITIHSAPFQKQEELHNVMDS